MRGMNSNAESGLPKRIRDAVKRAGLKRDHYAEQHVAELTKALRVASDDVTKQIRRFEEQAALKPWQEMRLAILKDLGKEIDAIANELHSTWKVDLRAHAEGSIKLGIEDGIGQLEELEHPDFQNLSDIKRESLLTRTFSTIDRAAVDFLANYELQLLGDVSTQLAAGVKHAITQGVLSGKSIPEIAREIGKVVQDPEAFRAAGKTVFKTAQQRATLIARTETLRAHNEGRKVFYREVGVTKVKWLTAHDERTCPQCAALDGKVFGIDDAPGPPLHPACRCQSVAYLK
jgi:SPP1 gp7 family putative phage head morphogenesis protein